MEEFDFANSNGRVSDFASSTVSELVLKDGVILNIIPVHFLMLSRCAHGMQVPCSVYLCWCAPTFFHVCRDRSKNVVKNDQDNFSDRTLKINSDSS